MPSTLFDKIWNPHVITEREGGEQLLYLDRVWVHDMQYRVFDMLQERDLELREPGRVFGVPDHSVPTTAKSLADISDDSMHTAVSSLEQAAKRYGFTHFGMDDDRRGIIHVVGPEQGLTLPGTIVVCGDSHTSTHGALGCIAFGIGTTELMHALATQTLWQRKPKQMRITVNGRLGFGISGKDLILAVIKKIGAAGGTGYAIEYAGNAIRAMSVEARMTVCNMTIEAGARIGIIEPDDKTIGYLHDRPYAPKDEMWEQALQHWQTLRSAPDASFDREITIEADDLTPMVTWGNSPEWTIPVNDPVPDPASEPDGQKRAEMEAALDYMDLKPGQRLSDIPLDTVFIGACTNSRIEDLRAAADVVRGHKTKVRTLVVPGSGTIKRQAEREGLDRIFTDAGMEWREPGCSLCVAVNGDVLKPGERAASTSNRNFRGRQGPGSRTHLVSPAMAAAAAIAGTFTDVRDLDPERRS